MKRITNLKDVSFPVNLQPVFIQNNGTIKAKGYKAVTGKPNGNDMIFSIVSDKYSLITNAKAFDIGTKVFSEYFESAGGGDFTIFKLTFPETKSFCHIDIINKNYKFNLWGLETYFPFMRITNSYNRTRRLKFEIGFIRRWCENGMIFEKETVHLNFIHYKNSAENILAEIKNSHKRGKLIQLENQFKDLMNKLKEIKIDKDYFIPMTAKILCLKFNIESEDIKRRNSEIQRKNEFVKHCEDLRSKYSFMLGDNAYSVVNIATDLINNRKFIKSYRYNDYQRKAGDWLKEFANRNNPVDLDEYLNDYTYLMNKN